jgi:hypothetical protein
MVWSDVPLWISVFVVAAAVAAAGGVTAIVHAALRRSEGSLGRSGSQAGTAAALLGGWLALSIALAGAGVFRTTAQSPFPVIVVAVLLPIAIGSALLVASPVVRTLADAIPPRWAIAAQTPRIFGFTFLVLMAQHQLPGVFANRAGWGDIFVGAIAPLVAYWFATGKPWARRVAIGFNVVGLADLAAAIGTGVLAAPSPIRQIFTTPSTEIMTLLPMVLVPIFLVPLATLFHIVSLRQLLHGARNPQHVPLRPSRAAHGLGQAGSGM